MKIHFDLISDLHVDTWEEPFSWESKATSLYAVVAGDISRERSDLKPVLKELSSHYKLVIFVDGNDEHRWELENLGQSYESLRSDISGIHNVVWLQDNSVVVDGVAFVGVNGWTGFDFDCDLSYQDSKRWLEERYGVSMYAGQQIEALSLSDAGFLCKTVSKLQTHHDVKKIVLITHYVPNVRLIEHDVELEGTHALNCTGNSMLSRCLDEDHENKVHTWCFGHYHSDVDTTIDNIRYVNNCRGRSGTDWCKAVYYPKRIEIDFS